MIFTIAILLTLNWHPSPEQDLAFYRVYQRTTTNLSRAGTFTNYTVVFTNSFRVDVPENLVHSFCVTAVNEMGEESVASSGIWEMYVRDKPSQAAITYVTKLNSLIKSIWFGVNTKPIDPPPLP